MPQIHPSFSSAPILIIGSYTSWASLPVTTGRLAKGSLAENWREGRKLPIAFVPLPPSLLSNLSSGRVPLGGGAPVSAWQPLPFGPSSRGAILQFQHLQETWFLAPLYTLCLQLSHGPWHVCGFLLWLISAFLLFSVEFLCTPVASSTDSLYQILLFKDREGFLFLWADLTLTKRFGNQCLDKGRGSCSSLPLCPAWK